ncbi:MAG: glycosyltransferase family 39 protein [Candidatus Omnitrophota bacterium]
MEKFFLHFFSAFYPWFAQMLFVAFAAAFVFAFKDIPKAFAGLSSRSLIALALILAAGALVRTYGVPHMHHVFFDEVDHLNIAQNLSVSGRLWMTACGGPGHCDVGILSFWPPVYHVLLSALFSVFGFSQPLAFGLTVVLSVLTLALVFVFVFLLFDDETTALLAASLFCVLPVHLKYSGTTALEIPSVFFTVLALSCALLFRKIGKPAFFGMFLSAAGLAVYTRPENVFLLPFFLVCAGRRFRGRDLFFCGFLALALFLQIYANIFVFPVPGWSGAWQGAAASVKAHVGANLASWFLGYFPWVLTLFAVWGSLVLWKTRRRVFVWAFVWILFFFLLYASYYIGVSDRYAMSVYLPLTVLAAAGLKQVWRYLEKKGYLKGLCLAALAVTGYFSFLGLLDPVFSSPLYREEEFIRASGDLIPADAYVISANPAIVIVTAQRQAVQPAVLAEIDPWPEAIVLFKDLWWHEGVPGQKEVEGRLRREYRARVLAREPIGQGRSLELVLLKKGLT